MTAIEKSAARALSAGRLRHDPLTTSGADIIGALAAATKLGSHLWRVKWAGDKTSVKPTAILLAKKIARTGEKNGRFLTRLATIALQEYVDTRCTHCNGRGHTTNADRVVSSCTHCHGTGIAQISDQRRIMALRISDHAYLNGWKARFSQAHSVLAEHDSDTGIVMREQLKN